MQNKEQKEIKQKVVQLYLYKKVAVYQVAYNPYTVHIQCINYTVLWKHQNYDEKKLLMFMPNI